MRSGLREKRGIFISLTVALIFDDRKFADSNTS